MANVGSERGRLRGVRLALTRLADQRGDTWQQRWQVSGADAAESDWKQRCVPWLDDQGVHVRQRLDLLSIGVISMICADLVRPSLRWLAAPGVSAWALARTLQASRDPDGFARLHAPCEADGHVAPSARHATVGRAAILIAAKGGTLGDVNAGVFLELLDVQAGIAGRCRDDSASWRMLHRLGILCAPTSSAEPRTIGQRSPPSSSTATG